MQSITRFLLIAVVITLASPCVNTQTSDLPYERLMIEAVRHFGESRQSGKLPWLAKDEHGNVETEAIPESQPMTYPVSIVLNVTTKAQGSRYGYTLRKDNETARWRPASAWRVHGEGQKEELKIER